MKRSSGALTASLHIRNDLHLARKTWHCLMGLVIVAVYVGSNLSRTQGVFLLAFFLGLDLLMEKMRLSNDAVNKKVIQVWGPIMRDSEAHRMSAIPHYLLASILVIALLPKSLAVLSILFLAIGDPLASLVGILYGKFGPRFSNGKSLIGTAAGVVSCVLVATLFLSSMGLSGSQVASIALLGGLAGGMAELLPVNVDDNFIIPVFSGAVLYLCFMIQGLL